MPPRSYQLLKAKYIKFFFLSFFQLILWRNSGNLKKMQISNFWGFQNFEKFELKISSIRIIRIIRKILLIRIIWIFGQRINIPATWYYFTTQKVRTIDHVQSTCVSWVACLFWALQAIIASNWKERHGSTPQICTTLDHTLVCLFVSPWFLKKMQFCRVDQTVMHVDMSLFGYGGP